MEDTLGELECDINNAAEHVLILVLMEDTLGAYEKKLREIQTEVLILVLMEDTLGEMYKPNNYIHTVVLILVLMEDTLGDDITSALAARSGLNPCFNGRYSRSHSTSGTISVTLS